MELESPTTVIVNEGEEIERPDSEEDFCDCNDVEIVKEKRPCNEHDGTVSVNSEDVTKRSRGEDRRPDSEERMGRLEEDVKRLCATNERSEQPPSIVNRERDVEEDGEETRLEKVERSIARVEGMCIAILVSLDELRLELEEVKKRQSGRGFRRSTSIFLCYQCGKPGHGWRS